MATVRDIMTSRVVAIRPETSLEEAVHILTEEHVGGAPVVSDDGEILGVISELSLIDVVFDRGARAAPVSRYMSRDVQVVHPDESLSRAAQLFALYSFRRLPVVDGNKLVGIATRRDLMNYSLCADVLLREPLMDLIPALAPIS
jgi:tRNA nucleotidyltransferase (CCA-adding enzyme)